MEQDEACWVCTAKLRKVGYAGSYHFECDRCLGKFEAVLKPGRRFGTLSLDRRRGDYVDGGPRDG